MKALVTGASGLLGRAIVEQLVARGDRVRALCRRDDEELRRLGIEIAIGNVRDIDSVGTACDDVEVVFHTAAVAGIWGPWRHFHQTNTLGTINVLACCLKRVPKLVYTSSPSVTFTGDDQRGVDESAPYARRWLCNYPRSKMQAERAVLAVEAPTLAKCVLRPHLIWGPRDRHLVPRLIARAKAGQLRRVGDGTNLIDIIHVDNAAAAHLQAADALTLTSPLADQPYFLSQGEPVNCWDWIGELLERAGLPPIKKSISLRAAWRIGAGLEWTYKLLRLPGEPRMTRFLAAQLGRSHWFDISRAKADFGYQPLVSTERGMEELTPFLQELARGEPPV